MSLNLARIQERMSKVQGWGLEGNMIVKEIQCKDYKETIWYVNKIAEIAEKQEHHPLMLISYNLLRISLTTHSEGGLTDKDFDLAEAIDNIK